MEEIVLGVCVPHCPSFPLDCALLPQEVRKGIPTSASSQSPSSLQSQQPGALPCAVCRSQPRFPIKRLIVCRYFMIHQELASVHLWFFFLTQQMLRHACL